MCIVLLPPGSYPIAVKKYIILYMTKMNRNARHEGSLFSSGNNIIVANKLLRTVTSN
jgi:hypothetical protein